jgi:alkanesulfonate monooxygenase SsuD/methylene tetrahydromethanopterin reductase-like flavin-dependent oxidoreductase (luciferase family)
MDNSNEATRKRIGFLSFGAWHPGGGLTHTGADALQQTVEIAVAAEQIGIDGAFVRVHHFARQLSSPFPLLAAIGVKTRRIEIGTGVIDMRYENPLYMAEEAAAADLLAGGRLQLGVSRGSPEPAWQGPRRSGIRWSPTTPVTRLLFSGRRSLVRASLRAISAASQAARCLPCNLSRRDSSTGFGGDQERASRQYGSPHKA